MEAEGAAGACNGRDGHGMHRDGRAGYGGFVLCERMQWVSENGGV